ncbi:MAG: hypothetical protein RL072_867 [Actinomycetota bacterium]
MPATSPSLPRKSWRAPSRIRNSEPACIDERWWRSSSGEPNSSREPLTNNDGTLMCGRCAVRNFVGWRGGCSGYPTQTKPPTCNGASAGCAAFSLPSKPATAIEHIRPPIERPPITTSRGVHDHCSQARCTASRTECTNTGALSGMRRPVRRYGKSTRITLTGCSACSMATSEAWLALEPAPGKRTAPRITPAIRGALH